MNSCRCAVSFTWCGLVALSSAWSTIMHFNEDQPGLMWIVLTLLGESNCCCHSLVFSFVLIMKYVKSVINQSLMSPLMEYHEVPKPRWPLENCTDNSWLLDKFEHVRIIKNTCLLKMFSYSGAWELSFTSCCLSQLSIVRGGQAC